VREDDFKGDVARILLYHCTLQTLSSLDFQHGTLMPHLASVLVKGGRTNSVTSPQTDRQEKRSSAQTKHGGCRLDYDGKDKVAVPAPILPLVLQYCKSLRTVAATSFQPKPFSFSRAPFAHHSHALFLSPLQRFVRLARDGRNGTRNRSFLLQPPALRVCDLRDLRPLQLRDGSLHLAAAQGAPFLRILSPFDVPDPYM
jgi:hypothetical protein